VVQSQTPVLWVSLLFPPIVVSSPTQIDVIGGCAPMAVGQSDRMAEPFFLLVVPVEALICDVILGNAHATCTIQAVITFASGTSIFGVNRESQEHGAVASEQY